MTDEIKTICRCLEESANFEQFKQNFLANISCGNIERHPMDREHEVRKLMNMVGIQDHLMGYSYIECAINLVLDDRAYINRMSDKLYPAIARQFGTMPYKVERAIRHAIENACYNCDPDDLEKIFGNTISPEKGKPTNGLFIARMVNLIRERM